MDVILTELMQLVNYRLVASDQLSIRSSTKQLDAHGVLSHACSMDSLTYAIIHVYSISWHPSMALAQAKGQRPDMLLTM